MYKNNKFWLIIGLLTILMLVLAGCAKEETPVETEAPAPVEALISSRGLCR